MQLELSRIDAMGATLVAVSPETPDNSLSTREKHSLSFEVLSDKGNKVAREFGIVFTLPEDVRPIYAGFGIDIPSASGDDTFDLPIPATYVIGTDRKIRKAFVDADYTKRLDPEDIIQALQSLTQDH